MKLISKFVFIYLVVTVIVLSIGGYLSYEIIKDELDTELKWRFLDRVDRVTYLLEQGKNFAGEVGDEEDQNLMVTQLPNRVEPSVAVRDTLVWNERLQQMEPNLKVEAYRNVSGSSYHITTYGALVETDDITEAVTKILLWILGMQVIGAIGVGFIVSNRLFKPFRETLGRLKDFDLQDKQPIEAEETNVEEFDAKGKLELLTETDLSSEQYQYVDDSQRAIKKLSRLSESLSLLTKIENHEFTDVDEVNMTKLIRESTKSFDEFIKLNGLSVNTDLEEDVTVHIHPMLADILWTNLFQNAIKHNVEEGKIRISLTNTRLTIANTGKPIDAEPSELFERFKKGDQSTSSIGLGLSIIKQIADQNNFDLSYQNNGDWHEIEVTFG